MRPVRTVAPAELPIDLAWLKMHLREMSDHEDLLIGGYLQAAVDHLDGWQGLLGRCMVTQTWRIECPDGVSGSVFLPFPDVAVVAAINAEGDPVEVSGLREAASGSSVRLDGAATQIDMTVGFGGAAAVPHPLKVAIGMIAADMFEHRTSEAGAEVMRRVDRLIAPYRWGRV